MAYLINCSVQHFMGSTYSIFKSFNFPKSNYAYNHSITIFARFCNLYVNWNIFEFWRKMLVVWLLPQDRSLSPCWCVWTISIDIENLNLTIFFICAHMAWISYFSGPVKCAWWVTSKCAYIIWCQAMHISQIVASEYLYWCFIWNAGFSL